MESSGKQNAYGVVKQKGKRKEDDQGYKAGSAQRALALTKFGAFLVTTAKQTGDCIRCVVHNFAALFYRLFTWLKRKIQKRTA